MLTNQINRLIDVSIIIATLSDIAYGCISTSPRTFSPGSSVQQFNAIPPPRPPLVLPRPVGVASPIVRPALSAANRGPTQPIPQQQLIENLLGSKIALNEFDSNGYNAEGGGPVAAGNSLSCDFDQRPCCWANVPPQDDQLDWHLATGTPNSAIFRNAVAPKGNYLVAYASRSAPSDEAQFASCAIGCASSPIIVRAKHWQSENVLLQVCQRESFPNTVNFNPLLNCQEFPLVNGLGATELVLPKASLVDIVFVASNFVSEQGDMAILDDIEVLYESSGDDCGAEPEESGQSQTNTVHQASKANQASSNFVHGKKNNQQKAINFGTDEDAAESKTDLSKSSSSSLNHASSGNTQAISQSSSGAFRQQSSAVNQAFSQASSANQASLSNQASANSQAINQASANSQAINQASANNQATGHLSSGDNHALASKTSTASSLPCKSIKCTFEDRNICNYKEVHQTESIRGITTSFQVVNGQFMNRVTGVREGTEGDYYAATFLYPREMAGLAVEVNGLSQPVRLRFQYYEGTHGVQLKGCCDSLEHCLFASDKFVSIDDRMWKLTEFTCPSGTNKILFVCENTRTNQGACAIDDIQLIENDATDLRNARTLC